MRPALASLKLGLVVLVLSQIPACEESDTDAKPKESSTFAGATPGVQFADVTTDSGIDFINVCGDPDKDYIIGMNGGGVALLDYDLDGRLDIFLVNGSRLSPPYDAGASTPPPTDALFRNLGDLRFENVTERAGLVESGWGCGVAVGDYDNDGDPDLFVTQYGPDRLWRNEGDGTFVDVTREAGVGDPHWGASCAFFDHDRDGRLDLFVVNYLQFDPADVRRRGVDLDCQYRGRRVACGPKGLPPAPCTLYRNAGEGRFVDVSLRSGIRTPAGDHLGYGLGVAILDFDGDGNPDVYVSCDTGPNLLFENRGDGTFREVGGRFGVAYNDEGVAQAGMGVDAAHVGGRVTEDLFVVNFEDDTNTYYRNEGNGFFSERTAALGLTAASFEDLGWGTFFFDANLDGQLDLFVANGHVFPDSDKWPESSGYRQRNRLFLGDSHGRIRDVTDLAGEGLQVRRSSRGAAHGDLDGDGDEDIVINEIDDRATLLENRSAPKPHWVAVRVRGTTSNRDGIGAVVTLETDSTVQRRRLRSGSSFASSSELVARFGLPPGEPIRKLRVLWPTGVEEIFPKPTRTTSIEVIEGQGRPSR